MPQAKGGSFGGKPAPAVPGQSASGRNLQSMRPVIALLSSALLLAACAGVPTRCVPAGAWASPALRIVSDPADAAGRNVTLLGETHDSAAAHAWQLDTIIRLAASHPDLVLGFEMFPRSDQPVLDRWVAGELSEDAFLAQSDWRHVWGFPPALYLPIFRFARDHRVPMRALNVSNHLVHAVGRQGWAATPAAEREGVGTPTPPSAAYRRDLADVMSGHGGPAMTPDRLDHFVDAQLVWDRAMAEAIATQRRREPQRPVVALMGAGHLEGREGVPHQLASLGIADALVLIPVSQACTPLAASYADAIYVTGPETAPPPS